MSIWTDEEARQLDPDYNRDDEGGELDRASDAVICTIYDALVGVNNAELNIELTLPNGKVIQWSSSTDDELTNKQTRQRFVKALSQVGLVDNLALELDSDDINLIMGENDE